MGCEKQNKAFKELFKAIFEENGYYEKLRYFAKQRGYSADEMAGMLYNEYEDECEGISIYWYMDSLEDLLTEKGIRGFKDIYDIVDYVNDHMLWKSYI